jgi:hypothetical protein
MATKKAPVVSVAPTVSALDAILNTKLSLDNVAGFICDMSVAGSKVAEGFHYAVTWMIGEFGSDAVFNFTANKCRTEESKKKHAVELGLEYPKFLHLHHIHSTIKERRADSWQQARRCYDAVEKRLNEQNTVKVQDESTVKSELLIALETAKAEVAMAKADKKRAELELATAKLDGAVTPELQERVSDAKAAYETADQKRQEIANKLQAERDKHTKDSEWAEYSKRVESLAEWCKKHDDYKDIAEKVLALLVV